MADLPADIADVMIADPPYGLTRAPWDISIDLGAFWAQAERVVKPDGALVVFASQPFTTKLIASNLGHYRYSWVWNKRKAGNIFVGKYQPMKIHEDICVFSRKAHRYFPVMTEREETRTSRNYAVSSLYQTRDSVERTYTHRYPTSILDFSNAKTRGRINPTQKPLPLIEYLLNTYSRAGDVVLDPFMGAFSTAIACATLNRRFIGYELNRDQWTKGYQRYRDHLGG